jgi:antitoxin CptB
MLENDLILARFLDTRGERISAQEIAALDRLLGLSDNELWDLLSSRQEVADPAVAPVLEALRAVRVCEDGLPPDTSVSNTAEE